MPHFIIQAVIRSMGPWDSFWVRTIVDAKSIEVNLGCNIAQRRTPILLTAILSR